jgi:hypothetical protein
MDEGGAERREQVEAGAQGAYADVIALVKEGVRA